MATIGIFDSGAGGLSVFREIYKLLPNEHYLYYSDNAHCPYGRKTKKYIIDRARYISQFLIDKGADIIVIACNTATGAAINSLRKEFDIKFIGMEPAVKPAALATKTGVIGVLATAGTLRSSKYLLNKEKYEDDITILEHRGKGWVQLVESSKLSGKEVEEKVANCVLPLTENGADKLVLGCTHYPFLIDTIKKIAGDAVEIIDPSPAVARQLVKVMEEEKIVFDKIAQIKSFKEADIKFFSSANLDSLNTIYQLICTQEG